MIPCHFAVATVTAAPSVLPRRDASRNNAPRRNVARYSTRENALDEPRTLSVAITSLFAQPSRRSVVESPTAPSAVNSKRSWDRDGRARFVLVSPFDFNYALTFSPRLPSSSRQTFPRTGRWPLRIELTHDKAHGCVVRKRLCLCMRSQLTESVSCLRTPCPASPRLTLPRPAIAPRLLRLAAPRLVLLHPVAPHFVRPASPYLTSTRRISPNLTSSLSLSPERPTSFRFQLTSLRPTSLHLTSSLCCTSSTRLARFALFVLFWYVPSQTMTVSIVVKR